MSASVRTFLAALVLFALGCGGDGGSSSNGGGSDTAADAAESDLSPVDAAEVDVSPVDAAEVDVSPVDAAEVDVSPVDAAGVDVSPVDAGADTDPDDDALEENDAFDSATDVPPWATRFEDLMAVSGDDDWFIIEVCAGGLVAAEVDFLHADGNIDAELIDEDGAAVLDWGNSLSDGEQMDFRNARGTARRVHVRVHFGGAGGPVPYALDVSVDSTLCDDRLEENDSAGEATPVSGGGLDAADLVAIGGDPDWFAVEVCAGGTLAADILFATGAGNIDAFVVAGDGATILAWGNSSTDNENLRWTNAGGTPRTVLVQVVLGVGVNGYDLTIDPEAGFCDDALEDNDASAEPTPLGRTSARIPGLVAVQGDHDWYQIDVCPGGSVAIEAAFAHALGNIDMMLYESNGLTPRGWGNSMTDNETITSTNATGSPATWLLDVFLVTGTSARYDLTVTVDCALGDDRFEDNDDAGEAAPLEPSGELLPGLVAISDDDDWFRIEVCGGGRLRVDAWFTHSAGNVDVELVDEDGVTVIGWGNGSVDDESIEWRNLRGTARTVFVRVYAAGAGIVNAYSLRVEPDTRTCDDFLEDNDTPETAQEIVGPGVVYSDLVSVFGDDDYFGGLLCAGGILTVQLRFLHADGDIDAVVTDAVFGTTLGWGNSETDDEVIVVRDTVGIGVSYLIQVFMAELGANGYEMVVDTACP